MLQKSSVLSLALLTSAGFSLFPLHAVAVTQVDSGTDGITRDASGTIPDGVSETDELDQGTPDGVWQKRVWLNYYAIYYGSSVTSPGRYQTGPFVKKDESRPTFVKNFLTAGYDLNDRFAIAGTGYFTFTPSPVTSKDNQFQLQDPSVRIADNSILSLGGFNWYGDARLHFPVTNASRLNDNLVGVQTFHYFSFTPEESNWNFGTYASARYNHFGKLGVGNDVELYLAPTANYSLNDRVALTFLYEMGASHSFGDNPGVLDNEGTDFQPGILWRITSGLEVNPYLNVYTGGKISLNNTAFGMTLSWMML